MSDSAMGPVVHTEVSDYASGGQALQEASLSADRDLRIYLAVKRCLDVAAAVCGILLCLPLWVIIAFAIKLGSRGPVIFRQRRPGQYGVQDSR